MNPDDYAQDLAFLREDLAYHQARVLLLIDAVCHTQGHQSKLDGLTKLAKLDFLLRYPALAPTVLHDLDESDPRLRLTSEDLAEPTDVEAPMIRYKYGPWDDRYYPVIGALVARGLLRYAARRRGSVALKTTAAGHRLAEELTAATPWSDVGQRCQVIAEKTAGMTGNALKDLIYQALAGLLDRPHRQVIR
ncbi:hypothetical protein [Catellatospora chokoriensis]|uniref:Uncharacterized protein n=1 Tax=Catellatospora chokoriensis TaxID=310353 RepID=A0A8J3NW64_9ACTN|nr:hypothetical protein [Catellatospora chokoriensis]GIF94616.1 hypothetical protein Cch02nite_80600 [Catellatospora chokoriensis]